MNKKYKFIVIEGPIGVGKTTLASKLSTVLNSKLMLESFSDNPFLSKFYKDMNRYALSTQLYFLIQRAKEFTNIKHSIKNDNIISDYFIEKDKLFAKTILSKDEYDLYIGVFLGLKLNIPKPDLIIYLQADSDTLIERITKRGVLFEQGISEEYIQKIVDAYTKFFHSYKESPLLIINTSNVDINNDNDYSMLLEEIKGEIKGKKYFNPSTID